MTTKKPLHDSFFARAAAGLRYAFTGKDWFGAGQPLEPLAPEETKGRQFDYPSAINTNHSKPRQSEGISFAQLRALADNYDLMRLIIERRKDQLAKLSWTSIRLKNNTLWIDDYKISSQIQTSPDLPTLFNAESKPKPNKKRASYIFQSFCYAYVMSRQQANRTIVPCFCICPN